MANFDVLGDIQTNVEGTRLVYAEPLQALKSTIDVSWHVPQGSLRYDTTAGFPWQSAIFGKHTTMQGRISEVRRHLLSFRQVTECFVRERWNRAERKVFYDYEARTTLGLLEGTLEAQVEN